MNVLGGYQKINLSTADLTASTLSVEGLSKACANANGKAVLAKMPDGTEAFGAVKGVTGGYQLSVMGADSKVSQLTVDDADDTFTMSESIDLTDAAEVLPAEYNDQYSIITTATSAQPYTAEYDGIVTVEITSTASYSTPPKVVIKTGLAHSTTTNIFQAPQAGFSGGIVSCFVKKGTILYGKDFSAGVGLYFTPYKPVS